MGKVTDKTTLSNLVFEFLNVSILVFFIFLELTTVFRQLLHELTDGAKRTMLGRRQLRIWPMAGKRQPVPAIHRIKGRKRQLWQKCHRPFRRRPFQRLTRCRPGFSRPTLAILCGWTPPRHGPMAIAQFTYMTTLVATGSSVNFFTRQSLHFKGHAVGVFPS